MEKVLIVDMVAEGGGVKIFGQVIDGVWSFTREWIEMTVDDDDCEEWVTRTSEPFVDLFDGFPKYWRRLYPIEVHPEFKQRLLVEYEKYPAEGEATQHQAQRERWLAALSGGKL